MNSFVDSKDNNFLKYTPENADYNQYWYSEKTIHFIINQIQKHKANKVAFVACPSLFFSVPENLQDNCYLFDIDETLIKKHKNGVLYDFNDGDFETKFPNLKNIFDFIVIDPPFVTEEPWKKFSDFAKFLMGKDCKILVSTILENQDKLKNMLGVSVRNYKPSIPHLVYQYNFFSNYEDEELNKLNPEIIE